MSDSKNIQRRHFLTAGAAASLSLLPALPVQSATTAQTPKGSLAGKRILIATGEFGESLETYYMIFRLREAGATPSVASLTKKRIQMVVHDFEPQYEGYTEKLGYQVNVDVAYKDVNPKDYHGLLIPGGRAPEEIRLNPHLIQLTGYFLDNKKPVGAMCHGVMVLYTARPIKGRKLTAYPGIRPDIELLGATFQDQEVVVDGSLVTSRGWPDLAGFMREFIRLL